MQMPLEGLYPSPGLTKGNRSLMALIYQFPQALFIGVPLGFLLEKLFYTMFDHYDGGCVLWELISYSILNGKHKIEAT